MLHQTANQVKNISMPTLYG